MARLLDLKFLGVRLAIDDFGTGYSSLAYLQRFPLDVLKVDKAFVDGVAHGPEESALAAAIIRLGHTLHLRTVAEGVEFPEQVAHLRRLGCQEAQGFLFARPLPADEIANCLDPGYFSDLSG
jgi:EAL domain-containing protein (putative c-di-GMP-specific phosphodiesterase class I)